ncbi:hypothetical protein AVEN_128124-1 [Araneus ventricosus]|uniref:Uncharacterized protein n=1 Tax=Araneus ventricosus TaxID=182803 RepID=A0A4Y1ZZN7_ARAVE|nr:hypothetical protein AVEN_128124-1 [Araneus ventricosus]
MHVFVTREMQPGQEPFQVLEQMVLRAEGMVYVVLALCCSMTTLTLMQHCCNGFRGAGRYVGPVHTSRFVSLIVEAIKITIVTHMPPVETHRGNGLSCSQRLPFVLAPEKVPDRAAFPE